MTCYRNRTSNAKMWASLYGWELFSGTFEGAYRIEYIGSHPGDTAPRKAKLLTESGRWIGTAIRTSITQPTSI